MDERRLRRTLGRMPESPARHRGQANQRWRGAIAVDRATQILHAIGHDPIDIPGL